MTAPNGGVRAVTFDSFNTLARRRDERGRAAEVPTIGSLTELPALLEMDVAAGPMPAARR